MSASPNSLAKPSVGALAAILALTLLVSLRSAQAQAVEAGSVDNRLYMLLWHGNPGFSLENISIDIGMPSFSPPATAIHIPTSVPPGSGRLAAFAFDVNASVAIDSWENALITVSGTVKGSPVAVTVPVRLKVAADAPAAVYVDSLLGTEEVDSDADGVAD